MLEFLTFETDEEWLANRRLGSSDAPVIMGVSPFKSTYTLWCELTGVIERQSMDSQRLHWGHIIEPVVCTEYERVTGRTVIDHGRRTVAINSAYPWLSATLDREVDGINAGHGQDNGVLEAKNAGAYKAREWTDQAPLDYRIQVQSQLTVTGYKWGSLAVLIGGNDFRWCDLARNEEFISQYLRTSENFWRMVQDKTEPPRDASDSTAESIRRIYSDGDGSSVILPHESADWHTELERAKNDLKLATQRKTQACNSLASAIGPASVGVLPQGLGAYHFTKSGKSRALRYRSYS